MTYALSFMLMASGLLLLMWTVAFSLQVREEEARDADGLTDASASLKVVRLPLTMAAHDDVNASDSAVGVGRGWYRLSCEPGMGRRCLPNKGGYADFPLELRTGSNDRRQLMKRIWMN